MASAATIWHIGDDVRYILLIAITGVDSPGVAVDDITTAVIVLSGRKIEIRIQGSWGAAEWQLSVQYLMHSLSYVLEISKTLTRDLSWSSGAVAHR